MPSLKLWSNIFHTKNNEKYFLFLVILGLALLIRLISLNQSLWLDEAINVLAAKNDNLGYFLTRYTIADFHPPGYFAVLWLWGHTFGFSEISVRIPSVIFGVLTVWIVYLIGKKLFSAKVGLLASLFLTFAPLHIYYSQEARMYSLAAFGVTFSIFTLIKFINKEKNALVLLFLANVLVLYSDYVAYFIISVQLIYLFCFYRDRLKEYLLSLLISVLVLLPWLFIFPDQLRFWISQSNVLSGWRNVVGSTSIKDLLLFPVKTLIGRISFPNKYLYALAVILTLSPFILAGRKFFQKIGKKTYLILFWAILPTTFAFLFSLFVPIFSYFRLLFVTPSFYLFLAYGLNKLKSYSILIIIMAVTFELMCSFIYLLDDNFQREDWKDAVAFVEDHISQQDAVVFEYDGQLSPYSYYSQKPDQNYNGVINAPAKSFTDLNNLRKVLVGKNKVYLFDYLVDVYDPNRLVRQELVKLGFKNDRIYNFRGVGFVRVYEK